MGIVELWIRHPEILGWMEREPWLRGIDPEWRSPDEQRLAVLECLKCL